MTSVLAAGTTRDAVARRATKTTNGPTSSAPSVRSAALRQPSSFQPPTPKSCHCIWPRSVVRSLQAATPLWSSTVRAITSPRISPSPTTSPSSPCRPTRPNSTQSKTSGNICAATSSRLPYSTVTTTSSTRHATPGHSSPTTKPASRPSQPDHGQRSFFKAVGISHLEHHLFVADRKRRRDRERVAVERRRGRTDLGIGDAEGKHVVRAIAQRSLNADAAVHVERNQIAVRRRHAAAQEDVDGAVLANARDHLVDEAIDAPVAAVIERTGRGRIGKRHHSAGAVHAEMLVGVIRGRVPGADLVDPRQVSGKLVLQFAHPQRAAAEAERGAVFIALLRIAGAIAPGRIPGKHRGEQRNAVGRVDLEPCTGRCERKGRTAMDHIGAEDAGPAEDAVEQTAIGGVFGTVDVSADGGTDHELIVGSELADAQREAVVETLFEPGSEQPRRREPVDIARVGDAADIVGDVMSAVVELKDAEMGTGAGPAGQFFQVAVDREFETAFVAGAPIDAAGQHGEGLADIGEGKLDALVLELFAGPAPVAG